MREIKFRGKSVVDGAWIYGGYAETETGAMIFVDYDRYGGWTDIPVDPETVEQYTGLKDKNGVRIYEGDIVRLWYMDKDGVEDAVCTVKWGAPEFYGAEDKGDFSVGIAHNLRECEEIEVIGFSHELSQRT